MGSWRDGASAEIQADVDRLLDTAQTLAKNFFTEHGGFLPFAVALKADGELIFLDVDIADLGPAPSPAQVLGRTRDTVQAMRTSLGAVAIAVAIGSEEAKEGAIEVRLEHSGGVALAAALPFERRRFTGAFKYGELRSVPIRPSIWV